MDIQNLSEDNMKRILTTKYPYVYPTGQKLICLSHQYLRAQISEQKSTPLSLQSLNFHRENPFTLQNSSVTTSLLEHEIKDLLETRKINMQNMIIIDCSEYISANSLTFNANNQLTQFYQKYNVVKGFKFIPPKSIIPSLLNKLLHNNQTIVINYKQIQASTSTQFILKQLQYEFNLSTSVEQSGFIGSICLSNQLKQIAICRELSDQKHKIYSQILQHTYECYQEYSIKHNCPIFVDFLQKNSNSSFQNFTHACQQDKVSNSILKYNNFEQFLLTKLNQQKAYPNIVISNPKLIFQQVLSKQGPGQIFLEYRTLNGRNIEKLYQLGFNICFQLARYQDRKALLAIARFLKEFPKQTILAYGIRYKTDMRLYGGQGLKMNKSLQIIQSVCQGSDIVYNALNRNILQILAWNIKKVEKIIVHMWNCAACNKQSPETFETFRKFGKDFCSIKCLKSFKF